ncbi:TIGR04219 family outer membrane beta-barrel protein [Desulfurobacterium thermolithotrophum]|uniref:TIGR04219 family outer membrane beta-barrel protein n=1 Tax=Desulfurobacterium thermolithotrophum TaxID=64160 RepID=UPI0013D43FE8|nr:TIGR04219 family outer membrane beta-barrel protein [Desulfurobacterium thermolithotrophum]
MKKALFTVVAFLASTYASSALTIEGGGGAWREKPTGWIEYTTNTSTAIGTLTTKTHVNLKEDLHVSDKTKASGWFKIEHGIPLLPDIRVQYTPMSFSGSGFVDGSFTFGDITVNETDYVESKFEANQIDVTLYYHMPFLRTISNDKVDLKAGINVKVIDGYAEVKDITQGRKESKSATIPVPMAHLSGKIRPIDLVGFEFSGNWIGYSGSQFYEAIAETKVYPIKHLFVGLGYRYQRLKIDNIEDLSTDIKIKGVFAEAGFEF